MSTNKFQYWPSNGQLGSTKFTMPTNAEDWPNGDALIGNCVYKEGKLVDFIDIKGLIVNDSKTTTFPYDYVNIKFDSIKEGDMTFVAGERTKYLIISYGSEKTDNSGDTIISDVKYIGCKTVDDVKAIDPDYTINDIVDGTWTQSLADLEVGGSDDLYGGMFYNCDTLISWDTDLLSLTNGKSMFSSCSNLTSFNSNLSGLTNGFCMFNYCSKLESFTADLSSLTYGYAMFFYCSELTSFSSDLSSLTDGSDMFNRCKLNPQSVMNIAISINDLASKNKTGVLHLGIGVTNDSSTIEQQLQTFAEEASFDSWSALKQHFSNKGWTVTFYYGDTFDSITY